MNKPKNISSQILEITDLSISFGRSHRKVKAVCGVNLKIGRGEIVALVGESGSGKTVTALSVLQLLSYSKDNHWDGSIKFKGQELMAAKDPILQNVRGNQIGMIFQEPMTSLNPLHTLEKQISETLFIHKKLDKKTARKKVLALLNQVGLNNAENRLQSYAHQLSGGQRQRVMIAMALANDPDLLIADEPTTALDVTIQAQILKLLKNLQQNRKMAMLLITHDLGVVRKIADRVYVMTEGTIVEHGKTSDIFDNPKHAYTQKLLLAEPKGNPNIASTNSPVILESKDLKIWFPIRRGIFRRTKGYIKAVDGVSLQLRQAHTLGIVGESGSGKTTLALGLLRLEKSRGRIIFLGEKLQSKNWKQMRSLRKNMQIVFQDPYSSLSPRMSVRQIIEEGMKINLPDIIFEERSQLIDATLMEVGLDPQIQNRYPHEFSGGQRQRIAIARALVLKPRLIVLDEPTSALDMSVQSQIVDLLRELQKKHKISYLFISHDLKVVKALADQVIVMKEGKIIEQGTAEKIFIEPLENYTKALIKAAFEIETIETI
ncbi:MAG: microcin ABC transporter ATP-binding protein [Rhodospirillaceae bacterium]|nr:microcin ABC transporter ATP-binding protein [Rhodospirillaceae bacterium]